MNKFVVFKDKRGFFYCEPIDQARKVYRKEIPEQAEVRHFLGRVIQSHVPAKTILRPLPKKNDPRWALRLFDGFTEDPTHVYVENDRWGPVKIIQRIDDVELAEELRNYLYLLSPEKSPRIPFNKTAKPRLLYVLTVMKTLDNLVDFISNPVTIEG